MEMIYFIGIIIAICCICSFFVDQYNKYIVRLKDEVFRDVTESIDIETQLESANKTLENIGYVRIIQSYTFDPKPGTEKIGLCPKCKQGYLRVRKYFAGYDTTYRRYPKYNKFIGCSMFPSCNYKENYYNLDAKKKHFKNQISDKFLEDFKGVYNGL